MTPAEFRRTTISPGAFARVGRALYGDKWQSPLARALSINERSVRYMAAGDRLVSIGIVGGLLEIVLDRQEELRQIGDELAGVLRQKPREAPAAATQAAADGD